MDDFGANLHSVYSAYTDEFLEQFYFYLFIAAGHSQVCHSKLYHQAVFIYLFILQWQRVNDWIICGPPVLCLYNGNET